MSYESRIFRELSLPNKENVMKVLLSALFKCGGTVKEFGSGDQEFTDEIADAIELTNQQRKKTMQTLVRKGNRIKRFPAWNRLLFRAADTAAKKGLLSRPSATEKLTGKREWMLTERGIDHALHLMNIPLNQKMTLPTKTYEVQKMKNKLIRAEKPEYYDPIDSGKKKWTLSVEALIRTRGFRQAVIEGYRHTCAVCGLRIQSPDFIGWEVEAAHIVPHRFQGKDDIWNGIALCRLHHWAFDTGWFTLRFDFTVEVSKRLDRLPKDQGIIGEYDFIRILAKETTRLKLPNEVNIQPHKTAILWHREHIFSSGGRSS
jgi:hypothetical protein